MSGRWYLLAAVAAIGSVASIAGAAPTAPGDLDTSFGTDGRVGVPIGSSDARGLWVAVQPDRKIVIGGTVVDYRPPPPPPPPPPAPPEGPPARGAPAGGDYGDFLALRLTPDGSLDSSFGDGGIVRTPIDLIPDGQDVPGGGALGPDGKILLGGQRFGSERQHRLRLCPLYAGRRPGPDVLGRRDRHDRHRAVRLRSRARPATGRQDRERRRGGEPEPLQRHPPAPERGSRPRLRPGRGRPHAARSYPRSETSQARCRYSLTAGSSSSGPRTRAGLWTTTQLSATCRTASSTRASATAGSPSSPPNAPSGLMRRR